MDHCVASFCFQLAQSVTLRPPTQSYKSCLVQYQLCRDITDISKSTNEMLDLSIFNALSFFCKNLLPLLSFLVTTWEHLLYSLSGAIFNPLGLFYSSMKLFLKQKKVIHDGEKDQEPRRDERVGFRAQVIRKL